MTTSNPGGRKPAICRFFVSSGNCVYGDDCQFLHQNPGMGFQKPFSNGPVGPIHSSENQGVNYLSTYFFVTILLTRYELMTTRYQPDGIVVCKHLLFKLGQTKNCQILCCKPQSANTDYQTEFKTAIQCLNCQYLL